MDSDSLTVMAELAIALAGFASLVAIVGQRLSRDSPAVQATRLRAMLESSLLTGAACVIPLIAAKSPMPLATVWRGSSAALMVAMALLLAHHLRLRRSSPDRSYQSPRWWLITAACLQLSAMLVLGLNTVGLVPWNEAAYLFAPAALLIYAGLLFLQIVVSFLSETPGEPAA
jgi:hypothetical protein